MWIPRFVYNADGEIGYIKEETTPGDGWTIPDLFMYKTADTTKPDFSLSGVWLQKDVDTAYSTKIAQMNQEESIYGFLANTKAIQITSLDATALQKYVVGADASVRPQINDPTNLNRIILKIINNNQYEPIKANITHNTVDKRIEIKVTYTANGIRSILDEYGEQMILTEEDGIILADTGSVGLAKGTYYFTVIDNKGNKKELSIAPNVDSLFKVAYISGTDNMDNTATYNKTQETKTTQETTLLNQLKATDTSKAFSRAIQDTNKAITAIGQQTRTSDDAKMYWYKKYNANSTITYVWEPMETQQVYCSKSTTRYGFTSVSTNSQTGEIKFINGNANMSVIYTTGTSFANTTNLTKSKVGYYKWKNYSSSDETIDRTYYACKTKTTYSRGTFISNVIALDGTYTIGSSSAVHKDNYWYVRNSLAPKYTLYKYDSNLTLKSTYDIDTKTLTTEPIDISNKGRNKVKLALNMYSSNYKVYISNDNTNWQEVTEITSGIPKELDVDGWDKLYVKVETNIGVTTNTTRVNNIDIAYYKD